MRYKQALFTFAVFLAIIGTAAAGLEGGALSFANVSVSPSSVIAGGNATIKFQIYNSYDFWLFNVNLQPTGSYPLLNVSPLSSRNLGKINPGLNQSYFSYTIAIPNTTPSGVYTLTFMATYYALSSSGVDIATSSMPLSFYVQNRPSIKLVTSNPQPQALYSGHNQTIDLGIENTGYGTARNVSVGISAGPGASILSSVTSFFISNLTRGQVVEEPILISAESTNRVELFANITYHSSDLGQRFSSTQTLNLSVAPAAQFVVTNESSALNPGSTSLPLTFTVKNVGTSEAGQISFSLQSTYPVTPVASTYYMSNLSVGQSKSITFVVSADSSGIPGNYPVTIYEQWKQPNGAVNQQFSGSNNYYVTVNQSGGGIGIVAEIAIAVVIVAIVAYMLSKRFADSKTKKKKQE